MPDPSSAATASFFRFNVLLLFFSVGLLVLGEAALWTLDRIGHLPPPPLTATSCIDEKFKFLHDTRPPDPNLVAVGSSVTWRNLDFSAIESRWPQVRPLNGAPCFLQIHQTAYLTRFYLSQWPSTRLILSVLSMQDFQDCSGDGAFFDAASARRYAFEHRPAWHLYFTNLRPTVFVGDVLKIRRMRVGSSPRAPLVMDRYGDGPLTFWPPEIRTDRQVAPECFDHLAKLSRDLDERGVRWVVVLLPPMPAWLRAYDPSGVRDLAWRQAVKEHLRASTAVVLEGREGPPFADEDFTDPDHLRWSSTPAFTLWIFDRLHRSGIASAPFSRGADAL